MKKIELSVNLVNICPQWKYAYVRANFMYRLC